MGTPARACGHWRTKEQERAGEGGTLKDSLAVGGKGDGSVPMPRRSSATPRVCSDCRAWASRRLGRGAGRITGGRRGGGGGGSGGGGRGEGGGGTPSSAASPPASSSKTRRGTAERRSSGRRWVRCTWLAESSSCGRRSGGKGTAG